MSVQGDTDDVFARWRDILAAMPQVEGQPTQEQMDALKQNKEDKKAFLETLTPDERKQAKTIEKDFKKQMKQAKPKPKLTNEEAAAKKKEAQERAAAKREEQEAKQQKKEATARAQTMEKPLQKLCQWLGIKCKVVTIDDETCFDVLLPKWLRENEAYLDEYDLDEGTMTLDADELEMACTGGVLALSQKYFGEGFTTEFPFDNLVERAETANVLASMQGLPPWYKHMSYPLTEEEIALVT
ncbi:hypothetical protein PTSG_06873 [Salpingoeca rosetta]|uniref:Uncharacterized protein n=1 Tax=Salpingoeca rosetta (strain ATCC 50818 / BSB-021) TaxID=946362 RepID=F2UF19_SALR5|nr:uncharacterized protein PTSG_06873 [Salpingoeca rosetta]EGD75219.1 hypothetical protein PTSG_06873 [Salpingoeca rosetta]|eukprot:XP_004992272.1 hypothetical protein PTSG_06873 [Salpingoeca rosetta]